MGVEPESGGKGEGGEQDLVLCFEPGQGLLEIGGLPGSGAGPGRGEGHWFLCRVQHAGGMGGGVQVVVKHSASSLAPVGVAVGVARLLGGVGTE